jgi:hypothetical protein
MMTVKRAALWISSSVSMIALTACSQPTINGFNLTAGPAAITIQPGGQAQLFVTSTATNSAAVTAAVVLYYLPTGVTISPNAPTVTTGSQTIILLNAAPNAPIGTTSKVQVTGYANLAQSTQYVNVSVVGSQ